MRDWAWWRYYRDYFPVRLVKTTDLPSTKNYLFCVYPHGILSSGAFCNFASNATNFRGVFPGLVSDVLTLKSHFWMPFSRELMHGLGKSSMILQHSFQINGLNLCECIIRNNEKWNKSRIMKLSYDEKLLDINFKITCNFLY